MQKSKHILTGTDFQQKFKSVIAAPKNTSEQLMALIADELALTAEVGLVTITSVDPIDHTYERLFSSMPDVYPVSGLKPANPTQWSETVIKKKQSFVANDKSSLAEVMSDHALIASLGFESILNIPLVLRGQVIGTLNCLSGPQHFSPKKISTCEDMIIPTLLALVSRN